MSRQSKQARKRLMRAMVTHEIDDKGRPILGKRRKGPAATVPLHGKKNRVPYGEVRIALLRKKSGG